MEQEVINSEELSRIIEENSPSPLIVPGTEAEQKHSVDRLDDQSSQDSAAVE